MSFITLVWLIIGLTVVLIGLAFIAAAANMPKQERKNKAKKGGQYGREW